MRNPDAWLARPALFSRSETCRAGPSCMIRCQAPPEQVGGTASGNEDQFRPPKPSGGYRFRERTLAGIHGNEEDAPKAYLLGREPRRSRKRPGQNGWLSQHLLPGVNTPGDDLTGSGSVEHDSAEKRQRVTSPTASASDGNGKRRKYISGIRLERPFQVLRLVVSGAMSQDGWRFLCWLF